MNDRMENIKRMVEQNCLGPDDTFEFGCDRCGKCCRNRNDILLNPIDVYRMAKYLKITPKELVGTYCERYQGETSRIVVVHLLPKEYRKTCPFLGKDGCSIHEAKPTVCAIYPLGRAVNPKIGSFMYFDQKVPCGRKGEFHKVSDWLSDFHLVEEEQDALKWMNTAAKYTMAMQRVEKELHPQQLNYLLALMCFLFYLNYDVDKPFSPQFETNLAVMKDAFKDFTGKELEEECPSAMSQ